MAIASVLVRGINDDIREWISNECNRLRLTQQEFLLALIIKAKNGTEQPSLFNIRENDSKPPLTHMPFSFIDLFAGIGGFRIALEKVGGKCVFSSEWDRYCQKTYREWFNEVPEGDITKFDPSAIPDHDVLAAGFPCQPFSIAGVSKKNALGRPHGFRDASQGNLFFNLAAIIQIKRPPVIILENVKNLQSHDKKRTWNVIHSTLERLKYRIFHKVIDAAGWVPQHRERIFIVGFDKYVFGDNPPFEFPQNPSTSVPCISDILEQRPDKKYTLSDHLWKYLQDYAQKHREKGNGFGFGLVKPDGISRTLSARYYKDGSEILVPQNGRNPRRLTPREAARIMGFPDYLKIAVSDTQAYRQFGNAVSPPVAEAVMRKVTEVFCWHISDNYCGCLLKRHSKGIENAISNM